VDGTPVAWDLEGEGELLEVEEETSGGLARASLRAGMRGGSITTVMAGGGEAQASLAIEEEELEITLTPSVSSVAGPVATFELDVEARTASGEASDDSSRLGCFPSTGRLEGTPGLQGGRTHIRWLSLPGRFAPRIVVACSIGTSRGTAEVSWSRVAMGASGDRSSKAADSTPGLPFATVTPAAIAGDLTTDQAMTLDLPDGSAEAIPIHATARYELTGLTPGERVTLRLGTLSSPNLAPVAHYAAESPIHGGKVADLVGGHDGDAIGSVTVVAAGYRGGAFDLGSEAVIRVAHHRDFEFSSGFMVQAAVRPPPEGTSGTLVEKPGEYRLDLVAVEGQARARFTVWTAAGEEQVVSLLPVTPTSWTVLSGRLEAGILSVAVGEAVESRPVAGMPATTTEALEIGRGFVGRLDEIRLFDLRRGALAVFPGGGTTLSIVADSSGRFETEIRSSGLLAANPAIGDYVERLSALSQRAADSPREPTILTWTALEASAYYEDRAQGATTSFAVVSWKTLAVAAKVIAGIFGPTLESDEVAVTVGQYIVLGAALVAIGLAIVGSGGILAGVLAAGLTVLDIVSLYDHAASGQLEGSDGLVLAGVAITHIPLRGLLGAAKAEVRLKRLRTTSDWLARGLARGDDAAGPAARALLDAVKETLERPNEARRLGKLIEVVAEGSDRARGTLLALIKRGGASRTSARRFIESLDDILTKTDDVEAALVELERLGGALVADQRLRRVVALAGRAAESGLAVSVRALKGLGRMEEVAQAANRVIPRSAFRFMKEGIDGVPSVKILENVEEVFAATGKAPGNAWDLVFNLTRKRPAAAEGALGELTAMVAGVRGTLKHGERAVEGVIEVQKRTPVAAWVLAKSGRTRARIGDIVFRWGGKELTCEVKRWKTLHGRGHQYYQDALDQLRRDFVAALTPPGRPLDEICWLFVLQVGASGLEETDVATLGGRFAADLVDGRLSKVLAEIPQTTVPAKEAIASMKDLLRSGRVLQGIR
jgi:hypothetical protein